MAFTDAQRNQIVTYMGYPALNAGTRYAAYYPIYSQIDLIGGDPVTQAPIEAILAELGTIDATIAASATSTMIAGMLKKADEAEFYNFEESGGALGLIGSIKRGRMLIIRLAQRMGGEKFIIGDYFGSYGGSGSSFSLSMG